MKKKIIISALLIIILSGIVYYANASIYNAPPGTIWSVNGQPVIGYVKQDGDYLYQDNLPNGFIIHCWPSINLCWEATSQVVHTFDIFGKSPNQTHEGTIITSVITYGKP